MHALGSDWDARFDRIERMSRVMLPATCLSDAPRNERAIGSQAIIIILWRRQETSIEVLVMEEEDKDWIDPHDHTIRTPRVGLPTGGVNFREGEDVLAAAIREAEQEVAVTLKFRFAEDRHIVMRMRLADQSSPEHDHEVVAVQTSDFTGEPRAAEEKIRRVWWEELTELLERKDLLRKHRTVLLKFRSSCCS